MSAKFNTELLRWVRAFFGTGKIRKKAEELLRETEERYRRLFETAKDGIAILHGETGEIEDANPFC